MDSPLEAGVGLALLVQGWNVCERLLSSLGPADPQLAARTDPASVRALLGTSREHNVCCTCRHAHSGKRSAAFFFGGRSAATAAASAA
eukprot:5007012-Pleurochrysis_carterae.AAC.1